MNPCRRRTRVLQGGTDAIRGLCAIGQGYHAPTESTAGEFGAQRPRPAGQGGEVIQDRQAQAEFRQHRVCPVHGRPESGCITVTQGGHSRLRERAEFVDERADGSGVLFVAQPQAADGLTGAAVDARICDDQVRLLDVLGEGMHPTALEPYGVGGAGRRRVQPGRFSVRHLLGQLRQREQISSVQDINYGGGLTDDIDDQ